MRLYLRAVALLSTLLIVGYGLVATPRFSSATMEWLAILGISFVLLLVALWPRLPTWMPRTQRSLVRTMIPAALPGSTMEDLVTTLIRRPCAAHWNGTA